MSKRRHRLTNNVNELLSKIVGLPCTRKEVGEHRSLSLGFGDEAPKTEPQKRIYRIWELGTYGTDWKILRGVEILVAKESAKTSYELDELLQPIHLGQFKSLHQTSPTDVRIELTDGISIEFSGVPQNDDEYFHVRCPQQVYIQFSQLGWKIGPSNEPWVGGKSHN